MFPFDIFERCEFVTLNEELSELPFVCGNKDLEDFFHNDAIPYAKEHLGKTYCFVNNSKSQTEIVAFFTVSNDSVKTTFIPKDSTNKVQRKIPWQKHLRTYPAVLLGRLGVAESYRGKEFCVGQQIINYLKSWFIDDDNKTGCRFLVVDAYNEYKVLNFYERNKFKYLYLDEEVERREQRVAEEDEKLKTRLMFVDLTHTEIIDYPF